MTRNLIRNQQQKSLRFGVTAVHVRSHRYGTIKLRTLAVKDAIFVENQIKLSISARDFVVNLVHNQLISPKLSQETVREWKDKLLFRVATAWIIQEDVIGELLNAEMEPFEAIRQAVSAYLEQQNKDFAETFRKMTTSFSFSSFISNTKSLNDIFGKQLLELTRQNQSTINSMLRSISSFDAIRDQLPKPSGEWYHLRDLGQGIVNITPSMEALRLQIVDISEISRIAQSSFSTIDWAGISGRLQIPFKIDNLIKTSYLEFSHSYTQYIESLRESASVIWALPPEFTRLPSVEYFVGVDLLETVIVGENKVAETNEKQTLRTEIITETEEGFKEQLIFLNHGLIRLWEGAEYALKSDNPDRARHLATSLRELFTHVLHMLSPDNEIRQWNQDPSLYDKNKPTRRARLLFICRRVNHGPFSDFLEKDIEAVLSFIQLFQRGTHEILIPYTEEQLVALKIRMEGIIRFLISIYRQVSRGS